MRREDLLKLQIAPNRAERSLFGASGASIPFNKGGGGAKGTPEDTSGGGGGGGGDGTLEP